MHASLVQAIIPSLNLRSDIQKQHSFFSQIYTCFVQRKSELWPDNEDIYANGDRPKKIDCYINLL